MPKITKTAIDSAEMPEKGENDRWIWDSEVPGFGVRINCYGRRTYVVRYRNKHRTMRKLTIGRCCDLTPDRARDLARKVFAQVAEGKDPTAEKKEAQDAPTMTDLRDRYQKEWATPFKKPRSAEGDLGTWRRYIIPKWGTRRVAEIDKADVLKLQGELAGKPSAANAVVALLGKAFNLAEDWKWRPQNSNPCRRLKKYKTTEREYILSPEQIGAMDNALTELVAEDDIPLAMAALVRLWLITGCRNSEVRTAKRKWIDANRQLLLLPDSKVGQRRIPLPDAAMDIIRDLDERYGANREWLIPGRIAGEHLKSPWSMFKRICKRAGIPPEARPHDLRHTVGSLGHHNGLSQKQIAQQLGHRQLSTTERYIHGVASEQSKAAGRIADVITVNFQKRERVERDATMQDKPPTTEPAWESKTSLRKSS